MSRSRALQILLLLAALALAAAVALQTGFARRMFHEVYERLAGVEMLGPPAARVDPVDSPHQRWLARAAGEIPVFDGRLIADVAAAELRPGPLFAPPPYGYHQHFNSGAEPARYLAINTPDLLQNPGLRFTDRLETGLDADAAVEWQEELEAARHGR